MMTGGTGKRVQLIFLLLLLAGCVADLPAIPPPTTTPLLEMSLVPVEVTSFPLATPQTCTNTFIPHTLAHTTTTDDNVIRMFEANGAGLATGDLDNDGDLDLVLGNLDFPNTILWNKGALSFQREPFGDAHGNTRAITLVDVDADGWLDIVLTRGTGELNYWRNEGELKDEKEKVKSSSSASFTRQTLPGINRFAYVLNWGDLDRDGDLDLVTATYDAGLLTDRGNDYLLNGGGGVTFYQSNVAAQAACSCTWDPRLPDAIRNRPLEPIPPSFTTQVLSPTAMALALDFVDLDNDQRLDILVGNDFEVRDYAWLNKLDGWQVTEPFATTTHSTMSLESGDINNDGAIEIFASDMNPYDASPRNIAEWLPVIADLQPDREAGDPQIGQNVLHVATAGGTWRNQATARGIDATGWSWSGRFGDLDNDGWLDFYVVNGMIEERMWAHLPNQELVEENQAFHNDGAGNFVKMPSWGLNSTASGRSMGMVDLDNDGDLDIVINNLRAPAQLFENQLCGGTAIEVDLQQTGVQNRNAVGARVKLYTNLGTLTRDVQVFSGYLSGDTTRVHLGLPHGTAVYRMQIQWSDGMISEVENLEVGKILKIVR